MAGKAVRAVAVPVDILLMVVTAVVIMVLEFPAVAAVAVVAVEELLVVVSIVLVVAVALGLTVREVAVLEARQVMVVVGVPAAVLETPVHSSVALAGAVMGVATAVVVVLGRRLLVLTKVDLEPPAQSELFGPAQLVNTHLLAQDHHELIHTNTERATR
jgi:hypothetical protein